MCVCVYVYIHTYIYTYEQVIFIGLNAVTVPHMVVTELSRVRQVH